MVCEGIRPVTVDFSYHLIGLLKRNDNLAIRFQENGERIVLFFAAFRPSIGYDLPVDVPGSFLAPYTQETKRRYGYGFRRTSSQTTQAIGCCQ